MITHSEILKQWIQICDIHSRKLSKNLAKVKALIPLTPIKIRKLTDDDSNTLDLIIFKFSKLQDDIGNKIFPTYLKVIGEDVESKSFIDIANRLEKLRIIEDAEFWMKLKKTRNAVIHEYPNDPELAANNLNAALNQSDDLLKFWTKLKKEIAKHVK